MEQRTVLVALLLAVLYCFLAGTNADEVKHKKIIIKVPKKIKHIHHHHVKKVHIWKHKPKPIHSIHVVEEEEPIGKEWQELLKNHKHKFPFVKEDKHHEEYEEEEEEEYEDEGHDDHYEEHKKSGSHHDPVVWKGNKGSRNTRLYESSKNGKGTRNLRGYSGWRGDRPKRQKSVSYHDDVYFDKPSYKSSNSRNPSSFRRKHKRQERKTKPKAQKPKTKTPGPHDYEYAEYDEFSRRSPVWPERKEHISWHMKDHEVHQPYSMPFTEVIPNIFYPQGNIPPNGEINLVKENVPDIPVVPAPNLALNYPIQMPNTVPLHKEKPVYKPKPVLQNATRNSGLNLIEYSKLKVPKEVKMSVGSSEAANGFRTEINHNGGHFSGYSSHVGHNAEGDAASFQSVRFGDKKKSSESKSRRYNVR